MGVLVQLLCDELIDLARIGLALLGLHDALATNPDIVEKYRAGNKKVTGAIVGAVIKATQGKADPGQDNKLIAAKLN